MRSLNIVNMMVESNNAVVRKLAAKLGLRS